MWALVQSILLVSGIYMYWAACKAMGESEPAIGDATAQLKNRRPICAGAL